jgi:hypothetical protein
MLELFGECIKRIEKKINTKIVNVFNKKNTVNFSTSFSFSFLSLCGICLIYNELPLHDKHA